MFKIGEFSKLTQVSIRMLRYYDEAGLLKPAETDKWTGYRMYSADQIPVLNKIIYLRDSGFNVSEIAAALNNSPNGMDDLLLLEQLDAKRVEILQIIRGEQDKLEKIEIARQEILRHETEMHYNISIKSIPGCKVLSLRRIVPDYYAEGELWRELSAFAEENHVSLSGSCNAFSLYHDIEYKETDVDIELCIPVKTFKQNSGDFAYRNIDSVPAMACTMVYGDFSNIANAYKEFAGWLEKNSRYQMSVQMPTRQIVHRGPWNESEPEKYLTELQIPLKLL